MNTKSDQYYIDLILEGDVKAFGILIERYKDIVCTLTFRITNNREEAEEMAQDTFIKAYKNLSKFKGDAKFSTWIYRIAYNNCLDLIGKRKRRVQTIEIGDIGKDQINALDVSLDQLEEKERRQAIKDSIQLLPKDDSFILTLYYFEELAVEEIATAVGITMGNVKVKLFRARKKLAVLLSERLEPEIIAYYGK